MKLTQDEIAEVLAKLGSHLETLSSDSNLVSETSWVGKIKIKSYLIKLQDTLRIDIRRVKE